MTAFFERILDKLGSWIMTHYGNTVLHKCIYILIFYCIVKVCHSSNLLYQGFAEKYFYGGYF